MDSEWNFYTEGYKRAGDLLAQHGVTQGEQHILVYPVVFLYRHYIELRLKEVVLTGNEILDHPIAPENYSHHDIDSLWRELKGILEEIDKERLSELTEAERKKHVTDIGKLEKGIQRFSRWDPTSQTFRYATDKNFNPFRPDLRSMSFGKLLSLVGTISYFLDAISTGLTCYLDAKHDLESESSRWDNL